MGVGQDASLCQSIHALSDFHHNVSIVDERQQFVLIHDAGGNILNWDVHVFEDVHWGVQIKVFDVNCEQASVGRGHNAIEQRFYNC
jgi:hypothetical protein